MIQIIKALMVATEPNQSGQNTTFRGFGFGFWCHKVLSDTKLNNEVVIFLSTNHSALTATPAHSTG